MSVLGTLTNNRQQNCSSADSESAIIHRVFGATGLYYIWVKMVCYIQFNIQLNILL